AGTSRGRTHHRRGAAESPARPGRGTDAGPGRAGRTGSGPSRAGAGPAAANPAVPGRENLGQAVISGVFIDRPRLAFVISIVITLAGLIALTQIPVAQFPSIVPPQVQVTATYSGASAAVVEATVAQPIEARVNGVDGMIYMRSTSGNDGTYRLTVTFAIGTDPDINTVNVQNRVQLASSQLPEEVQRQGLTVRKQSSSLLQAIALYSPKGTYDGLFLSNY